MKVVLLTIAAIIGLAAVPLGMSGYDHHTKREINALIENELGRNASMNAMDAFMRRHTERYAIDNLIDHQYAGIVKQDRLDKLLFNRKVGIILLFDANKAKMIGHNVEIYYTFL